MRLSILPILLTGATLVSLVAAEPIRVIENPSNANANIRFGHALANANVNGNDDNVVARVRPVALVNPHPPEKVTGLSRHFCGASLREKALRFSNAIRHALGLPLIEPDRVRPGEIHIITLPYHLRPPNAAIHSVGELDEVNKHPSQPNDEHHPHRGHHGHHGHHGRHGHHHRHHKSFLHRIHKAIMSLGPWEGRAVAFVLGCGLGVLLRMFWVLSVLAYRTVRGERGEETLDREYIVYEQVPETLFVAPPEYVDEKAKVEVREEAEERK